MLQRLKIQGFTLLDDVTINLTPGLNVLSGETGSGKSLVLTALGLLLGARTPASCVREGHDSALVEAEFRTEAGALRLARNVRRTGRGTCLLGDDAVPLSKLAEAGKSLLCFAFQHAQIEIGSPALFVSGLDVLAGHGALVREYGAAYADLSLARAELSRVRAELAGRDARQRLVREQVALLERLGAASGRARPLGGAPARAAPRADVPRARGHVEHALSEREGSVSQELSGLMRAAARVADDSSQARALHEALQRAALEVEEALRAAERLRADLDVEAQDLDALEQRFAELDRLAQSLGVSGDALAERLEALRQELTVLEGAEERAGLAEAELAAATERALGARSQTARRARSARGRARAPHRARARRAVLVGRPHRARVDRSQAERARRARHLRARAALCRQSRRALWPVGGGGLRR